MSDSQPRTKFIDTPPAGDGVGRLVVMWLCWVLLAVILVAAGVVSFA